jgi:uncharacterized protein
MENKKVLKKDKVTVVFGASSDSEKYSHKAIRMLQKNHIRVIALGRKDADLGNLKIMKGMPEDIGEIHTVTLYLSPKYQKEYYDYIISMNPRRIIFNPGTENHELAKLARHEGIEVLEECTLIMLSKGIY